jgi:hypothetical protein
VYIWQWLERLIGLVVKDASSLESRLFASPNIVIFLIWS